MSRMYLLAIAALFCLIAVSPAGAVTITIANDSFESGDAPPDSWTGVGGAYTAAGLFTDPTPDGTRALYVNNNNHVPEAQILSDNLAAGTYTLTIWLGYQTSLPDPYVSYTGSFNLLAGGTTLTSNPYTAPTIEAGQWRQASKTYEIAQSDPNIGQALQIQLQSGNFFTNSNFDLVHLDFVAAVPESSSVAFFGIGLFSLIGVAVKRFKG